MQCPIWLGLPKETVQQSQATSLLGGKSGLWESDENMQHYARFEAIGALHMELLKSNLL